MLTVGEILKRQREKLNLTTKQVEQLIRVREKFIQAIERNDWSFFTSDLYIKGIIKNYAGCLGIDQTKALAYFKRDYEKKEGFGFKQRLSERYLKPETKKIAQIFIFIFILLFFSYFIFQLYLFFSPPKLLIIAPVNNRFKRTEKIIVIGKTDKESIINIFNERIYQDDKGIFKYQFPLSKGKNTLIIEVIGVNGKKTVVKKDYFLE